MARRRTGGRSGRRRASAGAYTVHEAGGVVRIVPRALCGPGLAGLIAACALAGAAAVVAGGLVWWVWFNLRPADPATVPPWFVWVCPGSVLLLVAAALLVASARLWRGRSTPLVIDPTGRVRYGRRELIPSRSAKTVRLDQTVREDTDRDGSAAAEAEMCLLYVECINGRFVALPVPYFSGFNGWSVGEELARALAAALRIPVSSGPAPAAAPSPSDRGPESPESSAADRDRRDG